MFRACVCFVTSCFVHLHIVFSTSALGIEAPCEIQFRNLQNTFAPVRYVLHGGPCNSIDVLSTARFFQVCPFHCFGSPVLGVVLNCAVWLSKWEAECGLNYSNKWKKVKERGPVIWEAILAQSIIMESIRPSMILTHDVYTADSQFDISSTEVNAAEASNRVARWSV